MSDEAKTVTIEVAEWRRLRRIEDAAVWCIGLSLLGKRAPNLGLLFAVWKKQPVNQLLT